jgi:hypothetical protein
MAYSSVVANPGQTPGLSPSTPAAAYFGVTKFPAPAGSALVDHPGFASTRKFLYDTTDGFIPVDRQYNG